MRSGKYLPDRIVQRQQLPVRCDADERSDDALGNGLDVRGRRRAAAVEVPLENDRAALRDEKTVQSRKLGGRLDRRIQQRWHGLGRADLQASTGGSPKRQSVRTMRAASLKYKGLPTPFNRRPQKATRA